MGLLGSGYGMETADLRMRCLTQHRDTPVLRAAIRDRADYLSCPVATVQPRQDGHPGGERRRRVPAVDSLLLPARLTRHHREHLLVGSIDGFNLSEPTLEQRKSNRDWMRASPKYSRSPQSSLGLHLDRYRNAVPVVTCENFREVFAFANPADRTRAVRAAFRLTA